MGIALLIGFKIFVYSTNKYFHYEMTWVLQKTVFKSYLIPIILLYAFILLFSLICISLIYDNELKFLGYICLSITIFLLFKMYNITKNNILSIKENFEFQRYTTKVSYYNDQSQEYKIKSYNSIIGRIKKITFNTIDSEEYKTVLINDYLLNIESLITFEYFDAKIYNSISDHTTGVLFYSKFHKNVLEILSRINKLTNDLQSINYNYGAITSVLSSVELLKFDDNQGLHYDIKPLDIKIKKLFINNDEKSNIEKGLVVVNNSLENIQLALKNNYHTTSGKIDEIESQLSKYNVSSKLKSILQINIDLTSASNIVDAYIDAKLLGDINLKEYFKILFHFVKTPEITQIPSLRNTSLETIKYLLSFFITLRNETKIFDFSSIEELKYLLLYISNNTDSIDNQQLRKVHTLPKFKLHNDLVKELKKLVP